MKPTLQPARIPMVDVGSDGKGYVTRAWMRYLTENTEASFDAQTKLEYLIRSGSFYSRAAAVEAARKGLIPASVTSIMVNSYATAQDGGAALYARISKADILAYGMTNAALRLVSFQEASGDYWILDTDNPSLASVGCFGQELGVQPVVTEDYDCSDYITSLSDYISKCRKTGVIRYGDSNYYIHADLELDDFVGLSGPETQGRESLSIGDLDTVAGINFVPGIVLNGSATIKIGDNFHADYLAIKRAGIVPHTDLAGALDAQLEFTGTALTKKTGSARNVTIRNFVCYGFAFGLDAWKMHGARIGDCYGDCTTLVLARDSGETVTIGDTLHKRKSGLTNNDAISGQTVKILTLFDSGGVLGLTLEDDVTALGLTTGQRVGNNKLPDAIVNDRHTVTVVSGTTIEFPDVAWDVAYASYTLTERSTISWQPGCGSAVTAFYDAGGKVGVQTAISMPFKVGHLALLGCDGLSLEGMYNVLTVVSDTDFVLDVAWDAALATVSLPASELAAMPNARYHSEVISYWGTTEGYGAAAVNCDGIRINFANKGGSGFFADCGSAFIVGSNEGPQIGELDLGPPDTTGIRLTQPRICVTGAYKSTGIAVHVDTETASDTVYGYAIQATDGGRASLKVSTGRAVFSGFRTKGLGRVILDNIGGLDILEGDPEPSNFAGNAVADLKRTALRWRSGDEVREISGVHQRSVWDSSGNELVISRHTENGFYGRPQAYTSTGATSGGGAVELTTFYHGADIELTTNTATVILDATTVPDGFAFRVRNHRPAGDWTLPTSWGTGVVMEYALGAVHTKLKSKGWADFVVRDVLGTRYLLIRGDTAA